jgi:hypothetical protein
MIETKIALQVPLIAQVECAAGKLPLVCGAGENGLMIAPPDLRRLSFVILMGSATFAVAWMV